MIKGIWQELVLIRKELLEIRGTLQERGDVRELELKIDTGSISSRLLEEEYAGIGWKPIEMGGLTSIYDEIQKDLDKIAESLLRTQEICDKSMRISERAINQSNKALILSLISLGATALGIVAMVLIFLL